MLLKNHHRLSPADASYLEMDHQEWFEKFKIRKLPAEALVKAAGIDNSIQEEQSFFQSILIRMAIEMLPSIEKRMVKLIFYDHRTIREVAKKLNRSKSAIHRLKKQALERLSKSVFLKLALPSRILAPRNPFTFNK